MIENLCQPTVRYVPHIPYPPYAFVAGYWPHPANSPDGHRHGQPELVLAALEELSWEKHEGYLFGVDLFNGGYYWEAHEQWEALWNASGREGFDAAMCKILIKMAAASLKIRQQRPKGVIIHCERAIASLEQHKRDTDHWCGLSLTALLAVCDGIRECADVHLAHPELPVVLVHPYALHLSL